MVVRSCARPHVEGLLRTLKSIHDSRIQAILCVASAEADILWAIQKWYLFKSGVNFRPFTLPPHSDEENILVQHPFRKLEGILL